MEKAGIKNADPGHILVTNGSQQALDFVGKIFCNEGDIVIVEQPSYPGALNAFRWYISRLVDVPTDERGMIVEELEVALQKKPKLV